MAEFLVMAVNTFNPNHDAAKDKQAMFKIGDFVIDMPDGHPWGKEEGLPHFCVVKVPGLPVETSQQYTQSWKDNFDYEIVSSKPAQGQYTVRVFEKNVSSSGLNGLTREKVETFLNRWRCSNISTTTNSVQFDFSLWDAVRSRGFWEVDFVQIPISFVLISYSGSTGIGRIQATVPIEINPEAIIRKILSRGGVIISNEHPIWVFEIERSNILLKFRADVKEKTQRIYKVRQFNISEAAVNAIISAGGIVTRTEAQLIAQIHNGLDD